MSAWSPRPAVLLVFLLLVVGFHIALCSSSSSSSSKLAKPKMSSRKALLASAEEDSIKPAKMAGAAAKIKKKAVSDAKNQTKLLKPKKLESTTAATKKTTTKAPLGATTVKAKLPKLNKTAAGKPKSTESTKVTKLPKTPSSMKATKPGKTVKAETTTKPKKLSNSTVDASVKPTKSTKKVQEATEMEVIEKESEEEVEAVVSAEEVEGSEDLISEFRGLPAQLQETLMPDLARLSSTSKAYLSAANAGIAEGVRPFVGGRWAAAAASAASVVVLLLPLCLLTALVRRMGAYLPLLHRALLLAQAYLAIYFATLALAAAATGLEPLRFFHAASPAAYAWTQSAQSLGFVGYLVLQMVDLVAVFSGAGVPEESGAGTGEAAKALGLAQMVVGLAVGLHYYAAVFHRAAAGEAPRANWRVYAVYAACFVIVCACARAERRKKAYLAGGDGGAEEWKKS